MSICEWCKKAEAVYHIDIREFRGQEGSIFVPLSPLLLYAKLNLCETCLPFKITKDTERQRTIARAASKLLEEINK